MASNPRRNTQQRAAIRRVLLESNRPLSTREVLDAAQHDAPTLGIATVYRNLKALLDEGWLTAVELPGEPGRFELSGKGHHHHFRCRICSRVFEVTECRAEIHATVPDGFEAEGHEVIIYGRCAECSGKR